MNIHFGLQTLPVKLNSTLHNSVTYYLTNFHFIMLLVLVDTWPLSYNCIVSLYFRYSTKYAKGTASFTYDSLFLNKLIGSSTWTGTLGMCLYCSCPAWRLPEVCTLEEHPTNCCPAPNCPPDMRLVVNRKWPELFYVTAYVHLILNVD